MQIDKNQKGNNKWKLTFVEVSEEWLNTFTGAVVSEKCMNADTSLVAGVTNVGTGGEAYL